MCQALWITWHALSPESLWNPIGRHTLLPSFFRWRNWGLERLSELSKGQHWNWDLRVLVCCQHKLHDGKDSFPLSPSHPTHHLGAYKRSLWNEWKFDLRAWTYNLSTVLLFRDRHLLTCLECCPCSCRSWQLQPRVVWGQLKDPMERGLIKRQGSGSHSSIRSSTPACEIPLEESASYQGCFSLGAQRWRSCRQSASQEGVAKEVCSSLPWGSS